MRVVILDAYTTNPGDLSWGEIEGLCETGIFEWTERHEVAERLAGAEAAFTNKVKITAEHLDNLPGLKYIGVMATGYDNIDVKAAKKRGVTVTTVPEYASYAVAQLTFALILELCYGINAHHKSAAVDKTWSRQLYNSYWLKPLQGLQNKVLGIIGMGRIGEKAAEIGLAFGMDVLAYDVNARDIPRVKFVSLDELLRESDVVSTHCPLLPSTKGIINKETLALMKRTAFFVNTSRGKLVMEKDLADALNNGIIAGAGLDVLEEEPPPSDSPMFTAKNAVITPHIGWAAVEARKTLITETALNFKAFINGEARNVL